MAATLALLLAMSILLPSGAEMGAHDLVFLEVDTGNSDEDLSPTLRDRINIPKGFAVKEIGTSKYFAVLKESYLAGMTLKDVKEVTPVEDIGDTLKKFTISWRPHQEISNTNLTLFRITPSLKGQTLQQYVAELKATGRCISHTLDRYPARIYISKGSFPPTFYYFLNLPLEDVKLSFTSALDVFGGPGSTKNEISYVQLLHLAN